MTRPSWSFVSLSIAVLCSACLFFWYLAERNGEMADNAIKACFKPLGPVPKMQAVFYFPRKGHEHP